MRVRRCHSSALQLHNLLCLYQFPLIKKNFHVNCILKLLSEKKSLFTFWKGQSHLDYFVNITPINLDIGKYFKQCLCVYLQYTKELCSFWEHEVIKVSFFQDHVFSIGLFKSNREEQKLVSFSYKVHNFLSGVDLSKGPALCDWWQVQGSFSHNQMLCSKPCFSHHPHKNPKPFLYKI